MDIEKMKNIVILKNLPSNMVDEAFIILKDNVKIHSKNVPNNKCKYEREKISFTKDKKYVIREAEMLIEDYIENIQKKQNMKNQIKIEDKYHRLRYLTFFLVFFLVLSIVSNWIV